MVKILHTHSGSEHAMSVIKFALLTRKEIRPAEQAAAAAVRKSLSEEQFAERFPGEEAGINFSCS